MVEEGENPTKAKSQTPDDQNKTTTERVEKQTVAEDSDGDAKIESIEGSFQKGTATPDKEG